MKGLNPLAILNIGITPETSPGTFAHFSSKVILISAGLYCVFLITFKIWHKIIALESPQISREQYYP
jgi:hypothetical protein